MKIKLTALFLLTVSIAAQAEAPCEPYCEKVCDIAPCPPAFARNNQGDTPLHALVMNAEEQVSKILHALWLQEADAGQEHTHLFNRWKKMLRRRLLFINKQYHADLARLRGCGEEQLYEMTDVRNYEGKTVADLLESFPMVDREDAAYLNIRYELVNEFYDAVMRFMDSK